MATAAGIERSLDDRRVTRDAVSFRAALDGPAGIRAEVLIVNISPCGFMSRCPAALMPGDVVAVRLPVVGPRAARLVWSLGGRVGGEFVDPIAAEPYAAMLRGAPVHQPGWGEF